MKATAQLIKEHDAVKITLRILDKICKRLELGEQVNTADLENLLEFFGVFVDKCHHAKEENMLFVAMKGSPDPSDDERIAALLKDHNSGRNTIVALSDAVAAYKAGRPDAVNSILHNAKNYMTLLIQHIDIEDNILYPIADKRLTPEKHRQLLGDFERLEQEEIGSGKHEEFHKMIERLKGKYLV